MENSLTPPTRRKIKLTKADKQEIVEQKQREHAVSLFLDLEQNRTTQQIAEEVGLSLSSLKRLTQTPEFMELYDQTLMDISHHPRMMALQTGIVDLLPASYMAMKRLLGPNTAHTAQVAAVKLLWETASVGDNLDRGGGEELGNYLKSQGVNIENMLVNVNIPIREEYRDAFLRLVGADAIDGKAHDVAPSESPQQEVSAPGPADESEEIADKQ
jgi:hypothetical protein